MIITDKMIKKTLLYAAVAGGIWLNLWSLNNLADTEQSLQSCEKYIEQIAAAADNLKE